MKSSTGTIFKIYLLDESATNLQEGFIQLWKHKGKLQRKSRCHLIISKRYPTGSFRCYGRRKSNGSRIANFEN